MEGPLIMSKSESCTCGKCGNLCIPGNRVLPWFQELMQTFFSFSLALPKHVKILLWNVIADNLGDANCKVNVMH